MLRILDSLSLEGFVYKTPGGPPCELLSGNIVYIQKDGDDFRVFLQGMNYEAGMLRARTACIYFCDRGDCRKMLATRFIGSKAHEGSFISALCMQRNNRRIVLDFKYSGLWRLHGYKGEKNVLLGRAYDFHSIREGAQVKFLDQNRSKTFKRERLVNFLRSPVKESAFAYLQGNYPFAICICGPEQQNNDNTSAYECYWFEVLSFS